MSLPYTEKNAVNPLDAAVASPQQSHQPPQYANVPGTENGVPPHVNKNENPIPTTKFDDLYKEMDKQADLNDKPKGPQLPSADQLKGVVNNVVKLSTDQEALASAATNDNSTQEERSQALAQLMAQTTQQAAQQAAALSMQGSKMYQDQTSEANTNAMLDRTRLDSKLTSTTSAVFAAMPNLDAELGNQVTKDIVTRMHSRYPNASAQDINEYAIDAISKKFNIDVSGATHVTDRSPSVQEPEDWSL
tara:strand:- start:2258 stop:2998 length:741 start_codon:yes stop_codon:yes gene_type:complete